MGYSSKVQALIHYFYQGDKPSVCHCRTCVFVNETKESLPSTPRAEGDSTDDVSTVGAPCRCLAHIGRGQGFEGRWGALTANQNSKTGSLS